MRIKLATMGGVIPHKYSSFFFGQELPIEDSGGKLKNNHRFTPA
jgi:hypothetical protein